MRNIVDRDVRDTVNVTEGWGWHVEGVRLVGGEHKNTQRPDYLGKQARAQNQTLCHWGRSIGGGLRSVFGASSSSGQGGSGGLQGKEKQTYDHCYSPCPSYLKLTSIHGYNYFIPQGGLAQVE